MTDGPVCVCPDTGKTCSQGCGAAACAKVEAARPSMANTRRRQLRVITLAPGERDPAAALLENPMGWAPGSPQARLDYHAHTYQCVLPDCGNAFAHPADDDCFHPSGRCRHLLEAGWTGVWCRVYPDKARGKLRFSFGGWLCAEHSAEVKP